MAALSGEGVSVPISGEGEPASSDGGAECAPGDEAAGRKSSDKYWFRRC